MYIQPHDVFMLTIFSKMKHRTNLEETYTVIIKVLNFPRYKTIVSCQINNPKNGRGWG